MSSGNAGTRAKETMVLSPIALFTYNRPLHTRRTVESLRRNVLAEESELFVFSDGPRSGSDREKVEAVRTYIRNITGFKTVRLIERETNAGLAQSIISGVSEIVGKYGSIIVLEDDMLTSPFFLRYMNDALEFYKNEERVISIHGYLYPLRASLPETFFLRGADCWGWATWKRGWDIFEPDGGKLLRALKAGRLESSFDLNGAYPYTRMLRKQARGTVNSWAIRWHAAAFLARKLTLHPGSSLIANIGLDASGAHCSPTNRFDVELAGGPVRIRPIPVEEHAGARKALEQYYRTTRPSLYKRAVQGLRTYLQRTWRKCAP
jgi:glycosyltransferase involved in cell wall biosynthesis